MKKVLFPLLLGLSFAQAQTWTVEGPFRDEFGGCFRVATGQVQCLLKSTYIGSGPTYYGATYYAADSAAYSPDNKSYIATQTTINGKDVSRANVNVSKTSPVTVVYTFDYPKNFNTISLLLLDTGTLKAVPIKGLASTPAPNTTPSAAPQKPETTPPATAKAPAAPAPAERPTAFDIKLSNCLFNAQGGYSCKGAEIIPRR